MSYVSGFTDSLGAGGTTTDRRAGHPCFLELSSCSHWLSTDHVTNIFPCLGLSRNSVLQWKTHVHTEIMHDFQVRAKCRSARRVHVSSCPGGGHHSGQSEWHQQRSRGEHSVLSHHLGLPWLLKAHPRGTRKPTAQMSSPCPNSSDRSTAWSELRSIHKPFVGMEETGLERGVCPSVPWLMRGRD